MTELVRLLHFKFIIRNSADIPRKVLGIRWQKTFEPRGEGERDNKPPVVDKVESCSLQKLDLDTAGYQLVDAKTRQVLKGDRVDHYAVNFWFCLDQFARLSDGFQALQAGLTSEFKQICQSAFWQMRMFTNPFLDCSGDTKVLVPDQIAGELEFNERVAVKNRDGSPVLRWHRDEKGEKIGDTKFPIQPDHYFTMDGGNIAVVPVEDEEEMPEVKTYEVKKVDDEGGRLATPKALVIEAKRNGAVADCLLDNLHKNPPMAEQLSKLTK
jgi:hypothetical protein